MSVVDDIWEYLEDGSWHSAVEIGKKFSLATNTVDSVLRFLSKYDFVELDGAKVRICKDAGLGENNQNLYVYREVLR